jgi:ribosomal small subunit protein bTHX
MGKGDKKTRRGKIVLGSYGVRRKRKTNKAIPEKVAKPVKTAKVAKVAEVVDEVKPTKEKKAKTSKKEADTTTAKQEKETED